MSAAKHTPGPWHYRTIDESIGGVDDADGNAIGQSFQLAGDIKGQRRIANARLMAAAPELLAAMPTIGHPAGALLKLVAHYADGTTQTISGDVVTDAIAKATGGAS